MFISFYNMKKLGDSVTIDQLNYILTQETVFDNAVYLGTEANPYLVLKCAVNTEIESCRIHDETFVIGEGAFSKCANLSCITIPESVKIIERLCFAYCTNLSKVQFNAIEILQLPLGCFEYAGTDTGIDIIFGSKVKTIPDNIFSKYTCGDPDVGKFWVVDACRIKSVHFDEPSECYRIGERAFCGCHTLSNLSIPKSVKIIDKDAFDDCHGLKQVYVDDISLWYDIGFELYGSELCVGGKKYIHFSEPLKCIRAYLFCSCSSLETVELPDGVEKIEKYAFAHCKNLNTVYISSSVTSIDVFAFSGCNFIKKFAVAPDSKTFTTIDGDLYTKDGKSLIAYAKGKSQKSFTIPDCVEEITPYAFQGATNLEMVIVPANFFNVGKGFNGCDSLKICVKDVTHWLSLNTSNMISAHNVILCDEKGTPITSLEIPYGTKEIKNFAFYCCDCTFFKKIVIPDSVEKAGNYLFNRTLDVGVLTAPKYIIEKIKKEFKDDDDDDLF